MRDFAVGIGVAIFIALFIVYTYQPSIYETWFHRLFGQ
jgi:hypothetical protein